MKKPRKDSSIIPYVLVIAFIFLAFVCLLVYAWKFAYHKRNFWIECAHMNQAETLYSEYDGAKYRISQENAKAYGSLLSAELYSVDKAVKATGQCLKVYAREDDFVYGMIFDKTDDNRITRVTLQGKKGTYSFDIQGLHYFDKFVKAVTEEGYRGANSVIGEFPFQIN